MDNEKNQEILLRVDHLSQHFGKVKAVDDVCFEIRKGEVFGLVGESGCGKTTTGRSIIKIYDITSGSIYFKDQRICAGTGSYKAAIRQAKEESRKAIRDLNNASAEQPGTKEKNDARIRQLKAGLQQTIQENRRQIKAARFDHQHSARNTPKAL